MNSSLLTTCVDRAHVITSMCTEFAGVAPTVRPVSCLRIIKWPWPLTLTFRNDRQRPKVMDNNNVRINASKYQVKSNSPNMNFAFFFCHVFILILTSHVTLDQARSCKTPPAKTTAMRDIIETKQWKKQIEKVPRGIQSEKSRKDTASSGKLVSIIGS